MSATQHQQVNGDNVVDDPQRRAASWVNSEDSGAPTCPAYDLIFSDLNRRSSGGWFPCSQPFCDQRLSRCVKAASTRPTVYRNEFCQFTAFSMAMTLVSSAVHRHRGFVAKGGPQFKWRNNWTGGANLGFSRAELRPSCSRPLHIGKRVPCDHLMIGTDIKVQITRAMSSGSTSEGATISAGGRTLEELKKLVMRAVTNTNRGKTATDEQKQYIFSLLAELEGQNPSADPINSPALSGRWALLYTAPIDEKTSDKYAGTEEGPFLSRVKPASLGTVRQSRSFQVIDTERGAAENIAEFTFLGREGSLTIYGSVVKSAATEKGAVRVDVTFDSFVLKIGSVTFPSVSLSWISPKGWIETTYLDENFRIGRGDKGSIFVAVRAK